MMRRDNSPSDDPGPGIVIEQLAHTEGPRLRAIRIRALRDAPDAFSSTAAQAEAQTDEGWSEQLVKLATFVAVRGNSDVGLVRCMRDPMELSTAWLISMWVAPDARRTGVGSRLVETAVSWARSAGIKRLLLDVADINAPAIALYTAKGFRPNGRTGSYRPPREHITEHQRELRIE